MLVSGIIINYGIILCFQSLDISLIVECILSIFGLICFGIYTFRYYQLQTLRLSSISIWIGISFVCLIFLSPILGRPLLGWDARSIWFFHAKMIYVAGSIGRSAGWQHPLIGFSHPDYPNLIPALAAQITNMLGFWNEYIPKISLLFMLIPAVVWLFTFARRSFSFVILLLLIPFSFAPGIWNGYMDGYFALYFSIAMLLFGRYINYSRPIDLISSFCCLIAVFYIKNEGALAILTGFCSMILTYSLVKDKPDSSKQEFLMKWKYYLVGLLALIPLLLWGLYKQQWNLSNDLEIGTIQSFLRIISRLTDGSLRLIFQNVFGEIESAILLLGLLYFASVAQNESLTNESFPALIAAGIYIMGMIFIYLQTPKDLVWHLNTSIERIMLLVNGCIFVGCYFILNKLERDRSGVALH